MQRVGISTCVFLCALTAAFLVPGCRTAKRVVGTYEVFLPGNPERVVAAAKDALSELKLTYVSSSATAVDGKLRALTAQNKEITIKVKREEEGVSKFSVRVGMGDKAISNAIIDETKKRLKK